MSRILHILAICMIAVTASLQSAAFTVVIDAGHGGKDYGCIGAMTNEKTIVLDVCKRLGKLINQEYPEVNVVYTRDKDTFVTLQERARIANKAGGDLFISVHVNSVDKKSKGRNKVAGAQVYTLGLHKSESNLQVAMRENSAIELETDYTERYQGFDPRSAESYIIFELTQSQHMRQSIKFGDMVLKNLISGAGRADKGLRQAGFLVLWATSMPSVLVELDFICNPQSEKFLAAPKGRAKCASAIFDSFSAYYQSTK